MGAGPLPLGARIPARCSLDSPPGLDENDSQMRITRRRESVAAAGADPLSLSFTRRCRAQGVRVTAHRLDVYWELAKDPSHPTADAI